MGLLYSPSRLIRTSTGLRLVRGDRPARAAQRGWYKLSTWLSLHPDTDHISSYTLTGFAQIPRTCSALTSAVLCLVVALILLIGQQLATVCARLLGAVTAVAPGVPPCPGATLRAKPQQPNAPTPFPIV